MIRIALFALVLLSQIAHADTLSSEADIRPFTDRLMGLQVASGMTAVTEAMKSFTAGSDAEFQTVALSSQVQREQYSNKIGKTIGYEFISQKKVGDSLVRVVYIEKTERAALSWYFFFYKAEKG